MVQREDFLRIYSMPRFVVETVREEYSRLSEEKNRLYAEYGSLKKRMREYDAVKQNIDSILSPDRGQEQDKTLELPGHSHIIFNQFNVCSSFYG